MTPYQMLEEFHTTYGVAINQSFTPELIDLRVSLIHEEFCEVEDEFYPTDKVPDLIIELGVDKKKLTKELADLMYVVIGTATTFGLPLEEVFAEVHKSNMSKLGPDGKPILRADGKILKSPNYKEPDLDQFFKDAE